MFAVKWWELSRLSVELHIESKTGRTEREILKYRRLFLEVPEGDAIGQISQSGAFSFSDGKPSANNPRRFATVYLIHYIEDEIGNELPFREVGPILTGDPDAIFYEFAPEKHDIEFSLSKPQPLRIEGVTLSQDDIRVLGYFTRDLNELVESAFLKEEHSARINIQPSQPAARC